MGVPLPGANGPIGVLVLEGDQAQVHGSRQERALLGFASTQIASAIEPTRMRERLIQMAQFDALTGLPNRLLLRDRLAGALCRARRGSSGVSLLFVDLNRFTQFNDTLGHAAGDALLQQMGQRLSACLRSGDTVARIGGDEFVVMLEGSPPGQHAPDTVQRKIAQAFAAPFLLGHPVTPVMVRASVGMARFPDDGTDHDTLQRAGSIRPHGEGHHGLQRSVYFRVCALRPVLNRTTHHAPRTTHGRAEFRCACSGFSPGVSAKPLRPARTMPGFGL